MTETSPTPKFPADIVTPFSELQFIKKVSRTQKIRYTFGSLESIQKQFFCTGKGKDPTSGAENILPGGQLMHRCSLNAGNSGTERKSRCLLEGYAMASWQGGLTSRMGLMACH